MLRGDSQTNDFCSIYHLLDIRIHILLNSYVSPISL